MCDTVIIVRNEFKYAENGFNFKKFSKKDCSYFERKFIRQDSILLKFEEDVINKSYFIFYDKHNNKIEEGFWSIEYFYGNHLTYYKGGILKSKMILDTNENRYYIINYDKQGEIASKVPL